MDEDREATESLISACGYAPNAVSDYASLINVARGWIEADPYDRDAICQCGVLLMRAGDYQQAKALLSQALYTRAEVNQSRPAIDYFLAMTEHHLGNNEAAQLRLDRANEIAELRLRTLQNWRPRLYWRLLRDEAEGLINKSGNIAD